MKNEIFESSLSAIVNRQPFIPFALVLTNGRRIVIDRPAVAFDREGGVYLSEESGLVPFQCENVEKIEALALEQVR